MNSVSGIRLINFIKRSMMRGSKKTIIKRSTLMPKKWQNSMGTSLLSR
ncbi:hypothetical protein CU025_2531 [Enterococcus faecium]|uniref:Uncharacterized protein n=2 Tax=Enterococcus faecium TaxID=1352 RepID=A0A1B5FWR6_ENTFC|nr:hypothetical protein [Enterococcus faecium]AFK60265.1 hypothetical protein HMPREF0351_12641 [Enterococcus faecium DO]AGE31250.1 hypothetical protein M7W_2656 [Enterococcus faecium ATCC 8459 = NRRL B-2354]EFF19275.1 hypothetical protein EfmE1071_2562 [Enterococcus faecium E1071]EFF26764.1 hypothetical protein EfmE1679_1117 [Enterococcus faecium E1679]EFF33529.1 hypothetical protein EfmE1162_1822 [Enterococcus faecium E1162]